MAKSLNNDHFYRAIIRPNGDYVLPVPQGSYQLYLENERQSKNIEITDNYRIVAALPETVSVENFVVKVKQRKINIKRF